MIKKTICAKHPQVFTKLWAHPASRSRCASSTTSASSCCFSFGTETKGGRSSFLGRNPCRKAGVEGQWKVYESYQICFYTSALNVLAYSRIFTVWALAANHIPHVLPCCECHLPILFTCVLGTSLNNLHWKEMEEITYKFQQKKLDASATSLV